MKNTFFICLLLSLPVLGKAQKHELSLTYSPLSLYSIEKIVDGPYPSQDNYKVVGGINLDYYQYLNPWLKIGANVMYDKASVEGSRSRNYWMSSAIDPASRYKSTKHMFVIASQIDFEYLQHTKFKMSSGLSLGYANERLTNEGNTNNKFDVDGVTFHINLVSFRWGKKHGLTGNLGLGYKGLVNMGYFVRF